MAGGGFALPGGGGFSSSDSPSEGTPSVSDSRFASPSPAKRVPPSPKCGVGSTAVAVVFDTEGVPALDPRVLLTVGFVTAWVRVGMLLTLDESVWPG